MLSCYCTCLSSPSSSEFCGHIRLFWCQLFSLIVVSTGFSLCFLVINCFVQSGNLHRNWQRCDLAGVFLSRICIKIPGLKKLSRIWTLFQACWPDTGWTFHCLSKHIHQLNIHVKRTVLVIAISWSSHTDSSHLRRPATVKVERWVSKGCFTNEVSSDRCLDSGVQRCDTVGVKTTQDNLVSRNF